MTLSEIIKVRLALHRSGDSHLVPLAESLSNAQIVRLHEVCSKATTREEAEATLAV